MMTLSPSSPPSLGDKFAALAELYADLAMASQALSGKQLA